MATAILMGATSGAVHAVTGPDHLLSLGPQALNGVRRAFRAGLYWGLGHGLGTLLLSIPFVLIGQFTGLQFIAAYSERIAGIALMVTAVWALRASTPKSTDTAAPARGPLFVGLFHGVTGAGALVLMLPALTNSSSTFSVAFLLAFAIGSTLAMAALTAAMGLLGTRLEGAFAQYARRALGVVAFGVGAVWALAS